MQISEKSNHEFIISEVFQKVYFLKHLKLLYATKLHHNLERYNEPITKTK